MNKKFYIIFFNSKHGEDLYFHESLKEAIAEANKLAKKCFNTDNYKEVSLEGIYDNIYIKSITTDTTVSSTSLTKLFNQVMVNRHSLTTEDNNLDVEKYPTLKKLLDKYELSITDDAKVNMYQEAIAITYKDEVLYLDSKYFKNPSKQISNPKHVDKFNEYSTILGTGIDDCKNYHSTLLKLDEWASDLIDKDLKIISFNHDKGSSFGLEIK